MFVFRKVSSISSISANSDSWLRVERLYHQFDTDKHTPEREGGFSRYLALLPAAPRFPFAGHSSPHHVTGCHNTTLTLTALLILRKGNNSIGQSIVFDIRKLAILRNNQ